MFYDYMNYHLLFVCIPFFLTESHTFSRFYVSFFLRTKLVYLYLKRTQLIFIRKITIYQAIQLSTSHIVKDNGGFKPEWAKYNWINQGWLYASAHKFLFEWVANSFLQCNGLAFSSELKCKNLSHITMEQYKTS